LFAAVRGLFLPALATQLAAVVPIQTVLAPFGIDLHQWLAEGGIHHGYQ
jgi:hypothetical protein